MSPLRVLEGISELRRHLADLERQALLDARRLGLSPSDMAAALRVTRQSVYNKLKRLDEESARTASEDVVRIPDVEPHPG